MPNLELDQLHQASFKNVSFPCNVTNTTVGRAQVKHRFVNSDINNIEDTGLDPRIYRLTAIITGDNYIELRDRLLAAIEEGGKGVLNHPFYGRVENAVARPVTYSETIKTLGRLEIPITFDLDESTGIPVKGQDSLTEISQKKENVLAAINNDIAANYDLTLSFTGNFQSSSDKMLAFADALTASVTSVTIAPGFANPYRAKVNEFTQAINTLIQNPVNLAASITGLIGDIADLYETPAQVYDVVRNLFEFGEDDTPIVESTAGKIERARNNAILNQGIQKSALGVAYEAAAGIEFETVDAIDGVSTQLEEQFEEPTVLNIPSRMALDDIRATTQAFFDEQKITARRIITVTTNRTPVRLLSYQYYGDSTLGAEISKLNKDINVSYFDGDVEVLTG